MRRMGRIGMALAAIVLGVVAEARAQNLIRVAEVESVGGYVMFNDKATIWAEMRGPRVGRGLVQVERRFRTGTTLVMNGQISAGETVTLWNALYAAKPWRHATVHAAAVNTDFPDTVVTYVGAYKQTIRASYISPQAIPRNVPLVSAAMTRFLGLEQVAAQAIADAPLFTYDAAGGRAGYHRTITVANDGKIHDELDYASAAFAGQGYAKDGQLTPAELNALKTLCVNWARLPAAFPGNPQMVDGIGITTTLFRFGIGKAVFAGDAANRTREYQRILDRIEALANAIP